MMNERQRLAIKVHKSVLCDALQRHFHLFKLHFIKQDIISFSEEESVSAHTTSEEKLLDLLEMLIWKDGGWNSIIQFLEQHHYGELAKRLKTEAGEPSHVQLPCHIDVEVSTIIQNNSPPKTTIHVWHKNGISIDHVSRVIQAIAELAFRKVQEIIKTEIDVSGIFFCFPFEVGEFFVEMYWKAKKFNALLRWFQPSYADADIKFQSITCTHYYLNFLSKSLSNCAGEDSLALGSALYYTIHEIELEIFKAVQCCEWKMKRPTLNQSLCTGLGLEIVKNSNSIHDWFIRWRSSCGSLAKVARVLADPINLPIDQIEILVWLLNVQTLDRSALAQFQYLPPNRVLLICSPNGCNCEVNFEINPRQLWGLEYISVRYYEVLPNILENEFTDDQCMFTASLSKQITTEGLSLKWFTTKIHDSSLLPKTLIASIIQFVNRRAQLFNFNGDANRFVIQNERRQPF